MKFAPNRKAVVAAVVAAASALVSALGDEHLTANEGVGVGAAAVVAFWTVWRVVNEIPEV